MDADVLGSQLGCPAQHLLGTQVILTLFAGARREGGWKALKLEGPFDLSETGVIASIAAPLAEAGIGIFVISTYDTDYLLVKNDDLESAGRVLARDGHTVRPGS